MCETHNVSDNIVHMQFPKDHYLSMSWTVTECCLTLNSKRLTFLFDYCRPYYSLSGRNLTEMKFGSSFSTNSLSSFCFRTSLSPKRTVYSLNILMRSITVRSIGDKPWSILHCLENGNIKAVGRKKGHPIFLELK